MKRLLTLVAGLLVSMPVWAGYWVAASAGFIPAQAYQIGVEPDGSPLFLCKGLYTGQMYNGNINPTFGGCDVTVNGNIITIPSYSVWVQQPAVVPVYDSNYTYENGPRLKSR